MTVDDLKKYYQAKNDAHLARLLKRPRSTINYWNKNGIPPSTQATFQIKSDGKLKAELAA